MTPSAQHPALLRANLALYSGDLLEARRHLQAFYDEGGAGVEDDPLALWLDAQTQFDPAERLRRLRALADLPQPSLYQRFAQASLEAEQALEVRQQALEGQGRIRVPRRVAWGFGVLALAVVGLWWALSVFAPPAPPLMLATAVPVASLPPSQRIPLEGTLYQATYPAGVLQIVGRERNSQRVLSVDSGALVSPVEGARWLALELRFECRASICANPPEAQVSLVLEDGARLAPELRVGLAGEASLQAIALGRSTQGWLVYQAPNAVRIVGVQVAPLRDEFEALQIDLLE